MQGLGEQVLFLTLALESSPRRLFNAHFTTSREESLLLSCHNRWEAGPVCCLLWEKDFLRSNRSHLTLIVQLRWPKQRCYSSTAERKAVNFQILVQFQVTTVITLVILSFHHFLPGDKLVTWRTYAHPCSFALR